MEMESLRGELERLFELDELVKLSSTLLGFNPKEIGGTSGKASFVRALTDFCAARGAVEALCDAVATIRPNADPRLFTWRNFGVWDRGEVAPGDTLGGFTVDRELGDGPQGACYLAQRQGQDYRIKLLHPETTRDPRGLQRYLTFNRILGSKSHPSLPEGLEVIQSERGALVAQRWFEGESLAAHLNRSRPMPASEVQAIMLEVAQALAVLHGRSLSHGNLKLENVIVASLTDGGYRVQLQDAGADLLGARRASNGHIEVLSLASPKTVAPERLRGAARDASGDVYAFGAICYELVCGTPPFAAETALDAAVRHLTVVPEPPSAIAPPGWLSPAFEAFILRLLQKNPENRPENGRALHDELRALSNEGIGVGSDEDVQDRIDALLESPDSEEAARALDAVAIGAFRPRVFAAFAAAADRLDDEDPVLRRIKLALLTRAASGFTSIRSLGAAEAAYVKLIALTDGDPAHLDALDDVRRLLGKHLEVVESLLARVEKAETSAERATLLARIGEIYDTEIDDEGQAAVAFCQALCETPKNRDLVRRIEDIASTDPELWSEVLGTCSEAAGDEERPPQVRAPLLEQMGVWYMEKQGRSELALPCFQTALKLDPRSTRALDGVATVYRANKMWSELGDLLVHRADVSTSPSDARELRTQAAQVLEKHLSDIDGAQELYERIIREDPGDLVVSQALSRIYERNHELDRLVPLLTRQAEEERGSRRHTALCRLGDLHRMHLGDLGEARRCYEMVLAEAPQHPHALQGFDQTLALSGQYKELLGSLHRQLEGSPTPRQQVALWERIAQLYEEEFLLHADAAVALESVLRLDPGRTTAMVSLERLYRTLEQWQDLSDIYQRHAEQLAEPSARVPILLQRARVLAEHVGDLPEAIGVYEQVAAIVPERVDALEAIADLHEALGNLAEATLALQNVAERVSEKDAKIRYYMRTARLLESQGASDESLEWYGRVAALDPTHSKATAALRHAYAERGDTAGLIDLLRRDMLAAEGERAKARLSAEIAALELEENKNPAAAERSARQALEWDPSNLRALILVGDIAFGANRHAEAAEHYQSALPRADSLPPAEAARVLERYLDASDQLSVRAPDRILEHAVRVLELLPDEPALLAKVADLAFHHGTPDRTAVLYARLIEDYRDALDADQLALAQYRLGESRRLLGDFEGALPSLQEANRLAPDSPHPLVSLVQVHEARQDWVKLAQAKRQLLGVLGPEQHAEVLTELAELGLDKLADPEQARADLLAAAKRRPDDRRVLIRLMQLYTQEEAWAELVEVVDKLAAFVDDPGPKSKYLMTAAMVSARHLDRKQQALDYYEKVIALDPANQKALNEYVALASEQGDFSGAEQALRARLETARARGDKTLELEVLDALFNLFERAPNRLPAAVEIAEQVRDLDPQNPLNTSRLKALYERDASRYLDRAVAMHIRTLRQRPDDEDAYRRLRKLYTDARRADAAWCLCQVLHLLKLAEPEESRFFERGHSLEPAPAQTSLDESDWQRYLVHPSADPRVTEIFALIEPVVVALRGQMLPALGYDPHMAVDLSQHPYPLPSMLFYSAGVMGMPLPPTFENHHEPGGLLYLNSNPPSIVMGLSALQQLPPQTAAFIAARQLANYRPGFLLRHVLPTIPMLKAWLFAAFKACSPHFPLTTELEAMVADGKAALERFLPPQSREQLVEAVARLIQTSSAIDLKDWVMGVDLTADRVGLVLANDLKSVTDIIKTVEDPTAPPRERRLQELILFAIDEQFFALRRRLGINLESSA
jgi:tetratricopeptide (TPR) repeat protein